MFKTIKQGSFVFFGNKFFSGILPSKGIVYIAVNVQMKYFVKNWFNEISRFCARTTAYICYYCHKLYLFKFVESYK